MSWVDFREHVVLVTGAAGGIGGAAAAQFAGHGATVVAADSSSAGFGRLEPLLKEKDGGYRLEEVHVDDAASVSGLFDRVRDAYGRLDHVVNAAGIVLRQDSLKLSLDDWNYVLAVNLTGTFLCCQAAGRIMAEHGGGTIVNVASELALSTEAEKAAYIASKAGVIGLTQALATEWAPRRIRVNVVAPGATRTPMLANLEGDTVARAQYLARVPDGRFGEADEVADTILFLSSDQARHVVGHVLVVDGGYTVS